eukprot:473457-Amphidinium_carterae.2
MPCSLICVLSLLALSGLVFALHHMACVKAWERSMGFSLTKAAILAVASWHDPDTVDSYSGGSRTVLMTYQFMNTFIIFSPIFIWGTTLAFATYSGHGFWTAMSAIYGYVFNVADFALVEQLPDFLAVQGFVEEPLTLMRLRT